MRTRLTYSNVMASVAVFVALGGTSYAAAKIGSKDVRNGSLTGKDLKKRSIGQGKLKSETRWLLLDERGIIEEQSGGFTVVSSPGTNDQPATNPNVYINAGSSLKGNGLSATTAIQNLRDNTGDGAADPSFTGDTAVGRCGTDTVNCVPQDTNREQVLVVRALADNTDVTSTPKRVWVTVTP